MNNVFKKMLMFLLFAGIITVAGATEKIWSFDSISDIAPPPWAPKAAPGFVGDAKDISCTNGNLTFTATFPRSYFSLNFIKNSKKIVLDAKQYNLLKFRFYSPVDGRITLFYISPGNKMASMDVAITVAVGWNEYELDMNTMTFGREVHPKDDKDKNYKQWGGKLKQVSGLRIDTWFPKGTTVKFDYVKLSDGKTNLKDEK